MNKRIQRPTKGQQTGNTKTRVQGVVVKAVRFDQLWDLYQGATKGQKEELRRLAVELGRLPPEKNDPEHWAQELKKVVAEKEKPGRKPSAKSVKVSETYARQKNKVKKPSRVRNLK